MKTLRDWYKDFITDIFTSKGLILPESHKHVLYLSFNAGVFSALQICKELINDQTISNREIKLRFDALEYEASHPKSEDALE